MAALWHILQIIIQLWIGCIGVVVASYFLRLRAMNAALFAPAMAILILAARAYL